MKKHLIVIGTAVLLLVVGFCGCLSPESELYLKVKKRIRLTNDVIEIQDEAYAIIHKYKGDDFYKISIDYTAWDYDMNHDEIIKEDTYHAKAKLIDGEWEIRTYHGGGLTRFWSGWEIVDEDPLQLPQTFHLDSDNPTTPLFLITNESDAVKIKINYNRKVIDENDFGNRRLNSMIYRESGSNYDVPALPTLSFEWNENVKSKTERVMIDIVDGYRFHDEIKPGIYYISTSAPPPSMNDEGLTWIISISQ